jgi:hypothetical protein
MDSRVHGPDRYDARRSIFRIKPVCSTVDSEQVMHASCIPTKADGKHATVGSRGCAAFKPN